MTAHGWLADIDAVRNGRTATLERHGEGSVSIVPVLLAITLLLSVIAAPFITLRMRASNPGLLADEQEAQALLGLMRKARETFPKESDECRELYEAVACWRIIANQCRRLPHAQANPDTVARS